MSLAIKCIFKTKIIHTVLVTLIIIGSAMAKTPMGENNQTNDLTVEKIIVKMIAYNGNDLRRTHHALKVHDFARTIGKLEGLTAQEQLSLEVAAILHDIGIKESERKYKRQAEKD